MKHPTIPLLFIALAFLAASASVRLADAYTPVCGDACSPGGTFCSASVENCVSCPCSGVCSCQAPFGQNRTEPTGPVDRCNAPCWGDSFCTKWAPYGNTCNYCMPPPHPSIPNGICRPVPQFAARDAAEGGDDYWARLSRKQIKTLQRHYAESVAVGLIDPNAPQVPSGAPSGCP